MRWTAVVPLKLGPDSKSRLSPVLSCDARAMLTDRMAAHVLAQLRDVRTVADILLLAPRAMSGSDQQWVPDRGRGLNAELDALRASRDGPMIVIHADLPLLEVADVDALVTQAEMAGSALAPDRHGQGTNAIAMAQNPAGFAFAFGPGSFARHSARLNSAAIVDRTGLSHDLDTPADLLDAQAMGFVYPADRA